MPAPAEIPVSEHLKRIPPPVRRTVQAARRMVKLAGPKAKEISYRSSRSAGTATRSMYKVVRYAVDDANVVGIGTFPTYATLFFYRGRELDDPTGLLLGTGKNTRFLRLRTPADAETATVKRIVRHALKLGGLRD
jgi:hypothetical protein